MKQAYSFKFVDETLNRRLLALLNRAGVKHTVDKGGAVHYSPDDEGVVENDLISSIRDQVFSSWQVLTCPVDWIQRYREYMTKHGVPFREELSNNQLWFLIPRKYRPHSWKLEDQTSRNEVRAAQ